MKEKIKAIKERERILAQILADCGLSVPDMVSLLLGYLCMALITCPSM